MLQLDPETPIVKGDEATVTARVFQVSAQQGCVTFYLWVRIAEGACRHPVVSFYPDEEAARMGTKPMTAFSVSILRMVVWALERIEATP